MPPRRLTQEEALGRVLRRLRLERGLSQEALAHEADRHRTYVSLLERGRNSPSLLTIFRIADVLKVRPSEIVRLVETEIGWD
jgi:transcriptional regulator with XRE-family HTH domain